MTGTLVRSFEGKIQNFFVFHRFQAFSEVLVTNQAPLRGKRQPAQGIGSQVQPPQWRDKDPTDALLRLSKEL